MNRADSDITELRSLGGLAKTTLALVFLLLLAWIVYVAPQWARQPDLSHGWLTPVLFVWLLRHSRAAGPRRFFPPGLTANLVVFALVFVALAALTLGGLYAAATDWTHPLVYSLLAIALTIGLGATMLVAGQTSVRLLPLNWAALVAASLWLLSAPWPPGAYARLSLQLQLWVTETVLVSLHWLGIPAEQQGNILILARTTVGVEDACSGIRSLFSCVYAALVLSAFLQTRPGARVLLIGFAAPLAIVMNFLRSLLLTLLAHRGVDISGAWHDVSGYAVLAATAVVLAGIAIGWGSNAAAAPTPPRVMTPLPARRGADRSRAGFAILATGYAIAAIGLLGLVLVSRPAPPSGAPAPDLTSLLPSGGDGFRTLESDLAPFAAALGTTQLAQRTYLRGAAGEPEQVTVYLAYWAPGQAPVSAVAAHTPDLCWPGSGWTPEPAAAERAPLPLDDQRTLPPAEYRRFRHQGTEQHVWYWHIYNGRVIAAPNALSPRELIEGVFRFGVRNRGEQLFVRVSSNRSWNELRNDPLLRETFQRLSPFGL